MKEPQKLPPNPCPGFRPHDLPQKIPILNWQVGWIEPVYKEAVCCYCGNKINNVPGACWTRVLGSNDITCGISCACMRYDKDILKKVLFQLLLLSCEPTKESKDVFSQKQPVGTNL
jgi:hypothetical protein